MALTKVFKPTKFASMFDAYKPGYEDLDEIGIKVEVTSKHFSLIGPNGEKIVSNVGLAQGVVGLAAAGDLPNIAKAPVKAIIESSYKHAMKGNTWTNTVTADDIVDEDEPVKFHDIEGEIKGAAAAGLAKKLDESLMSAMVDEEDDGLVVLDKKVWDVPGDALSKEDAQILAHHDEKVISEYKAKHPELNTVDGSGLPKVKLVEAKALYQPVDGTSDTSTYFCVGIAGPFKFGARRKGGSLSIRVEGPVGAEKNALVTAGFNESYIGKGYTSVHFHGVDDIMAQRALGAVLMGTGFSFSTPIPDLAKIAEKGE